MTWSSGHALCLSMGLRNSSWGWDWPSNPGVWGYVEVRFLPCHCIVSTDGAASMSGTATALFQPLPQKTSPEPAGTLPEPRLRCLRADFLCGASAAGSCCGCKKTPYLGQIARNLSFAAALEATGNKALFRQNKVFFGGPAFRNKGKRIAGCDPRPQMDRLGVASWSLEVDISPHVGRGSNSSSPFQFAQTGPKSVCSLKWT